MQNLTVEHITPRCSNKMYSNHLLEKDYGKTEIQKFYNFQHKSKIKERKT
jgi:hypothetical protein